ncbi:MAG TPA: GNAT family N-acetyltransferase [Dehalococcoidia bacterium]|nr:GNAT family N-acetyltransferase [Dehalococcoidia bacterium]
MARADVTLGPLDAPSADALAAWTPGVAAAAGLRSLGSAEAVRGLVAASAYRVWRIDVSGEESPAGLIMARGPEGGEARIVFVALRPDLCRRGLGHGAALEAERRLVAAGARRVLAAVSARHGLSVYFWLRLGYRPLLSSAWPPCEHPDVGWMARDVA